MIKLHVFAFHDLCHLILFSEAEKVVGWAKNHHLSSCLHPSIKGEKLFIPRERYMCESYHSIVYVFRQNLKLIGLFFPLREVLKLQSQG
jgi:hypothetical protein